MTRVRAQLDLVQHAIGDGRVLVYEPVRRRVHILQPAQLAALRRAAAPGTVEEQSRRLAPAIHGDARGLVEALVASGLLVPVSYEGDRELEAVPPISGLCIPTRNRPELLRRALASWLTHARDAGRELEVLVVDDGRTPEESEVTRGAVRGLVAETGHAIRHATGQHRLAYAERVAAEAGVAPELVRSALVYDAAELHGAGACRNAAILHNVGRSVLLVDDDVLCAHGSPPERDDGIAVQSRAPIAFWFPDAGLSGAELLRRTTVEPFATYEALLGRRLARLGSCDTSAASATALREIEAGRARVVAVQSGLAGDAATGSLGHYLLLRGEERDRLLRSEDVFRHAAHSRQVLMAPTRMAVTDSHHVMSFALAVDLREVVPPFFANGRNADGLWGVLLRRTLRGGFFGYVPLVSEHHPPSRAGGRAAGFANVAEVGGNDLLYRAVLATSRERCDPRPEAAMQTIGRRLVHWGELSDASLDELLRVHLVRTRSVDLARLYGQLDTYGDDPPWWATEVRAAIAELERAIVHDDAGRPRDYRRAMGRDASSHFREMIASYGRLLMAWPALLRAAASLREAGVALGEVIEA